MLSPSLRGAKPCAIRPDCHKKQYELANSRYLDDAWSLTTSRWVVDAGNVLFAESTDKSTILFVLYAPGAEQVGNKHLLFCRCCGFFILRYLLTEPVPVSEASV